MNRPTAYASQADAGLQSGPLRAPRQSRSFADLVDGPGALMGWVFFMAFCAYCAWGSQL